MKKLAIYIEDDAASRLLLKDTFKYYLPEFDLLLYEDGVNYQEKLADIYPELVIIDIQLGLGPDGYTIMEWMRQAEIVATYIALTAETGGLQIFLDSGFHAVIPKPILDMATCAYQIKKAIQARTDQPANRPG